MMPEKTKPKENSSEKKVSERDCAHSSGDAKEPVSEDFQKRGSYYYDDAHGYEIYNPDEDDEDED